MSEITPIVMPKWGLSMQEGKVNEWLVKEGSRIEVGMPILNVETDKLANDVEATDAGLLRRIIAAEGDVLPVKALLGVMADESVSDADIDAFVAAYEVPAGTDDDEDQDKAPAFAEAEVDGIRVRYQQRGEGDSTVLLIHGFGGDANSWLFNIDELAQKHRVVAVDLPAHGGSAVSLPEDASVDGMAAFMLRFLDVVGIRKAGILAHSMGGAIAARMALLAPDRVSRLALVSPCGFGSEINLDYINGFIDAQSRRELKPVLGLLMANPDEVSRAMIDDVLRYKRLDGVTEALQRLRDEVFPLGEQAAQPGLQLDPARHPLLILWGKQDHIVPVQHADAVPQGASVHRFDDSGHMCHMDHSAKVNPLLRDFF